MTGKPLCPSPPSPIRQTGGRMGVKKRETHCYYCCSVSHIAQESSEKRLLWYMCALLLQAGKQMLLSLPLVARDQASTPTAAMASTLSLLPDSAGITGRTTTISAG